MVLAMSKLILIYHFAPNLWDTIQDYEVSIIKAYKQNLNVKN